MTNKTKDTESVGLQTSSDITQLFPRRGNNLGISVEMLLDVAMTAHSAGRLDSAIDLYNQVLDIQRTNADALHLSSLILFQHGDVPEALKRVSRAAKYAPTSAEIWSNYGIMLRHSGDTAGAIKAYARAVTIDSNNAAAFSNLGNAHRAVGELQQAIKAYRRAIEIAPDFAGSHYNLALCMLQAGDLPGGMVEAIWRWKEPDRVLPATEAPLWTGDDLAGRSILLHAEQGMGDTLQFARFIPLVKARGAGRVIVAVQPALVDLLAGKLGADVVFASDGDWPAADCHASLFDLIGLLGITLDTIPAEVPYLTAKSERVARWRERLAGEARPKIGLVWAGNPEHAQDQQRSAAFELLAPLLARDAFAFYSLQKGAEGDALEGHAGADRIVNLGAEIGDFDDTAAILDVLDLVISVDTAVVHLAGALGRPVWAMIAHAPDWRWMSDRRDSPWYPSLRLFRQQRPDDWAGVIEQVGRALDDFKA